MSVILYSTHCPKCKVLSSKLLQKGIDYDEINDIEVMAQKGFTTVPMLEVNEVVYDFKKAVELYPTSSKANFDLGRYYFNKAIKVRDEKTDLTGEELKYAAGHGGTECGVFCDLMRGHQESRSFLL